LTDLIASINPSTTYTLTVNGVTGGEVIPLNPENYQEGADVTAGITMITGTEPEYNFLSWTSDWPTLDGSTDASLNFQMPAQDVTLTPNVEVADNSTWGTEMHQLGPLGWGAWDPNNEKYFNGTQKTSNDSDTLFFYHSGDGLTYTCILYMFNEHSWLQAEITAGNYNNLRLDYIDANDSLINTLGGDPMTYTDTDLTEQYFSVPTFWENPQKIGISTNSPAEIPDPHAFLAIRFDTTYSDVRARITKIDTGEIITSRPFAVYDDSDPNFGLGV
jgi:hypothetical protein